MSSYVPPHLRQTPKTSYVSPSPTTVRSILKNVWRQNEWNKRPPLFKPYGFKIVTSNKAVVIPKVNGKYVMVQYRNRRGQPQEMTMIAGGCPFRGNMNACALKELHEESRGVIKKNNFIINKRTNFKINGNRQLNGFLNKNTRAGKVTNMTYHVYEGRLKNGIKMNNIRKKFHNINPNKLLQKEYAETSNIKLMSRNNIQRLNKKDKYFIVNKLLPYLN